jgi:hypothetical protein
VKADMTNPFWITITLLSGDLNIARWRGKTTGTVRFAHYIGMNNTSYRLFCRKGVAK